MTGSLLDEATRIAASVQMDRVPPDVLIHLGHVIADTVAVSRADSDNDLVARLVQIDTEDGLVRPAATVGGGAVCSTVLSADLPRTSSKHAAFLNASAGTFLELDEGIRPTGHPGMHVVPAALAVAERRHAAGTDLMRAVLAGYEVTARLFLAFRLRYPVHPHGHFGAVGAAVAVAMLEGVDPVAAARVAGTTMLLPLWDACYERATVRNTWIGWAARTGVRAAVLVRAGFEGSSSTLEVGYGTIAGDLVNSDAMSAPLNYDRLGVTRNYFKLHSTCALTHTAIEAVQQMGLGVDPQRVLSVHVETVENNMKLDRQPRTNDLSGRFSLPYAVATAIVLGRSDPDAFVFRPHVAEVAKRVTVSVAADLQAKWPDASPARVSVQTSSGTITRTVENPHGHHDNPVATYELRAKFDQPVGLEDGERWWPQLTGLADVPDVADLLARPR